MSFLCISMTSIMCINRSKHPFECPLATPLENASMYIDDNRCQIDVNRCLIDVTSMTIDVLSMTIDVLSMSHR